MTLPSECGAVKEGEKELSAALPASEAETRGNDAERNKRGMRNDLPQTSSCSPREGRQSMYSPQKIDEERANIEQDCQKVALLQPHYRFLLLFLWREHTLTAFH